MKIQQIALLLTQHFPNCASWTTWSANVLWMVWGHSMECRLFKSRISFVCFLGQFFFIVMYVTFYKISPMQILKIILDV